MEVGRAKELLGELDDGWHLNAAGHLEREYRLKDFAGAMNLANKVADIAEQERHHPTTSKPLEGTNIEAARSGCRCGGPTCR